MAGVFRVVSVADNSDVGLAEQFVGDLGAVVSQDEASSVKFKADGGNSDRFEDAGQALTVVVNVSEDGVDGAIECAELLGCGSRGNVAGVNEGLGRGLGEDVQGLGQAFEVVVGVGYQGYLQWKSPKRTMSSIQAGGGE